MNNQKLIGVKLKTLRLADRQYRCDLYIRLQTSDTTLFCLPTLKDKE
jgi:hypothetical protein